MIDKLAIDLARRLDGLPLALATAGVYLGRTGISCEEYLAEYESAWTDLVGADTEELPCKSWPQGFYKRHPEVKPRTLKSLEWERHSIYDKVVQWFTLIGRELQNPAWT